MTIFAAERIIWMSALLNDDLLVDEWYMAMATLMSERSSA